MLRALSNNCMTFWLWGSQSNNFGVVLHVVHTKHLGRQEEDVGIKPLCRVWTVQGCFVTCLATISANAALDRRGAITRGRKSWSQRVSRAQACQ